MCIIPKSSMQMAEFQIDETQTLGDLDKEWEDAYMWDENSEGFYDDDWDVDDAAPWVEEKEKRASGWKSGISVWNKKTDNKLVNSGSKIVDKLDDIIDGAKDISKDEEDDRPLHWVSKQIANDLCDKDNEKTFCIIYNWFKNYWVNIVDMFYFSVQSQNIKLMMFRTIAVGLMLALFVYLILTYKNVILWVISSFAIKMLVSLRYITQWVFSFILYRIWSVVGIRNLFFLITFLFFGLLAVFVYFIYWWFNIWIILVIFAFASLFFYSILIEYSTEVIFMLSYLQDVSKLLQGKHDIDNQESIEKDIAHIENKQELENLSL